MTVTTLGIFTARRNIAQLMQDSRGCNILVAADRVRSAIILYLSELGYVVSQPLVRLMRSQRHVLHRSCHLA